MARAVARGAVQRDGFLGSAAEAFFRAWQGDHGAATREALSKCLASQGLEEAEIATLLAAPYHAVRMPPRQ